MPIRPGTFPGTFSGTFTGRTFTGTGVTFSGRTFFGRTFTGTGVTREDGMNRHVTSGRWGLVPASPARSA